jgi:hypothetical protein
MATWHLVVRPLIAVFHHPDYSPPHLQEPDGGLWRGSLASQVHRQRPDCHTQQDLGVRFLHDVATDNKVLLPAAAGAQC